MQNNNISLLIGIIMAGFLILLPNAVQKTLAQSSGLTSAPNEVTYALLAAVLSGGGISVVGSVITMSLTNKANRERMFDQLQRELEIKRDEDLRNRRIEAYKILWEITKPWDKYYRGKIKTYRDADILLDNLNNWYFDNAGGMFLTMKNRDILFELKDELIEVCKQPKETKKISFNQTRS